MQIYVDADGCPVKDEVYRVAERYGLQVHVVANSQIRVPRSEQVTMVLVDNAFDAADDWIVEQVEAEDIVITGDILLAGRCLEQEARVLSPRGKPMLDADIGSAKAARELNSQLRDMGLLTGGPSPIARKHRSLFLQQLDQMIQAIKRKVSR